jgi:hypothetical protein
MASYKRKLQEDAAHSNKPRHESATLEELLLHIKLRIEAAKRLGLQRVRLEMLSREQAAVLEFLLEREITSWNLNQRTSKLRS